uniref:C2 domain-containing protein n=1 Tax=Echinostoma caproni TaxID=27848 RepID=A0A183AJD0_9TREM
LQLFDAHSEDKDVLTTCTVFRKHKYSVIHKPKEILTFTMPRHSCCRSNIYPNKVNITQFSSSDGRTINQNTETAFDWNYTNYIITVHFDHFERENLFSFLISFLMYRMFQLKCHLPIEKDLHIRIKDYDLLGTDDIIGETYVDLENRRLTKYRATCGLPQTYCVSGPNQWRDSKTPSEILADVCDYYSLPPPQYEETGASHNFGQKNFALDQFERGTIPNPHLGPAKERLSLHILNHLPLVKEHVETRMLFSPLQPNIEQGKVQMWIDLFPTKLGEPGPPVDVSPRQPNEYELRVVVWNTEDVILQETSITGEQMSDIYVKGWLAGVDERQMTDVHYRSLDGEGNFNWRFVFPFFYLPAENTLIVRRKEHFWSLDATEIRLRPTLIMQVWDNDLFSADDFLGTLELNLASMPAPAKTASKCTLNMLQSSEKGAKTINIFDSRRARGFWPFMNDENGEPELTNDIGILGKIEMELELLTKAEASVRPAGLARDEPNENPHLEPPK